MERRVTSPLECKTRRDASNQPHTRQRHLNALSLEHFIHTPEYSLHALPHDGDSFSHLLAIQLQLLLGCLESGELADTKLGCLQVVNSI